MLRPARTAFVLLLAHGAACRAPSELNGTALLVSVNTAATAPVQLSYRGESEAGELLFGPVVRPEAAAGAVPPLSTVRVLLPDVLAGQGLVVTVEGLDETGAVLSVGETLVTVVRGREVALTVNLEAPMAMCSASCAGCCELDGTCRLVPAPPRAAPTARSAATARRRPPTPASPTGAAAAVTGRAAPSPWAPTPASTASAAAAAGRPASPARNASSARASAPPRHARAAASMATA